MRKIVLATNVAETSITIDDVTVVVDCGKVKETRFDALTQMSCLVETWASVASCDQRRGRAGRVSKGVCFRMFPRHYLRHMQPYTIPEIKRVPLASLCLQVCYRPAVVAITPAALSVTLSCGCVMLLYSCTPDQAAQAGRNRGCPEGGVWCGCGRMCVIV